LSTFERACFQRERRAALRLEDKPTDDEKRKDGDRVWFALLFIKACFVSVYLDLKDTLLLTMPKPKGKRGFQKAGRPKSEVVVLSGPAADDCRSHH